MTEEMERSIERLSSITVSLMQAELSRSDARISRLVPTERAQAIRWQREAAWGELLRARLRRLPPEDVAPLVAAVDPLRALVTDLAAGE